VDDVINWEIAFKNKRAASESEGPFSEDDVFIRKLDWGLLLKLKSYFYWCLKYL